MTFDEYSLTVDKEIKKEDVSVDRTLNLTWDGNSRIINHSQFNLWPNYGVVENVSQLADFVKKVKYCFSMKRCFIVVHFLNLIGYPGYPVCLNSTEFNLVRINYGSCLGRCRKA